MNKKVIVIGAGGHAKVIADIIIKSGDEFIGFLDDNIPEGTEILGYKVLGKINDIQKIHNQNKNENQEIYFAIGIGNNKLRKEIFENNKVKYYTAIHPSSIIALDVNIGEGTMISANTVINVSTKIGKCCIINTGSILEHDNRIEDFVHISTGVVLAGTVKVGKLSYIGSGVSIKHNIDIEENTSID